MNWEKKKIVSSVTMNPYQFLLDRLFHPLLPHSQFCCHIFASLKCTCHHYIETGQDHTLLWNELQFYSYKYVFRKLCLSIFKGRKIEEIILQTFHNCNKAKYYKQRKIHFNSGKIILLWNVKYTAKNQKVAVFLYEIWYEYMIAKTINQSDKGMHYLSFQNLP